MLISNLIFICQTDRVKIQKFEMKIADEVQVTTGSAADIPPIYGVVRFYKYSNISPKCKNCAK